MNTPRNGRKITKISHSTLAKPPRSWLRKMSTNTRNSRKNQSTQMKMMNIDQNTPSSGKS